MKQPRPLLLHSPLIARSLLFLLLPFSAAQACGPDFSPDIFVRPNRPDLPAQYVAGQLGLLQASYPRADLLVAYRYLSGGSLDADEQKGWQPTYSIYEQQAPGFTETSNLAEHTRGAHEWVLASAGAQQAHALARARASTLGQHMLDSVSAHPEEPRGPQALFLILRMIRYGCTEAAAPPAAAPSSIPNPSPAVRFQTGEEAIQLLKLKQQASRLLRKRYAASPWTSKAAPFAG